MKIYKVTYEMGQKEYEVYIVAPTMDEADVLFTDNYPLQTINKMTLISDKVLNYWHEVGI